jgi:hypothetical protein
MIRSSVRAGDGLFPREWDGRDLAHSLQHTMRMAEMWTATPDMIGLIRHAAQSMPPETLERTDLPSQQGFLWLPDPLRIVDVRGETLPIHAILWDERELGREGESPGRDMPDVNRGIVITMFTRLGDKEDPLRRAMSPQRIGSILASSPMLSIMHSMSIGFGYRTWDIDTSGVNGDPEFKAAMARRLRRSLHDGDVIEQLPDGLWSLRTADGHVLKAKADETVQFLKAYFSFVSSTLTETDREYPGRVTSKWLRRLGMPDSPISVIRLRRRAHGNDTGRGAALTYRHVRRGHWRHQWAGSERDGTRHQRWVWIAPTIVGPEDGELRVRDVVNVVAR